MQLHQLIYVSTATEPLADSELHNSLVQYRSRNQATGLTGLLLYSDGLFLQLLEGVETAVHELYHEHIAGDPRHRRLHLLADGPLAVRTFPHWSMGFLHTTLDDAAAPEGYLNPAAPEFLAAHTPQTPAVLLRLLHQFVGL